MATALIHSYGSVKPLELRLPVAKSTCETALKEVGKILQLRKESLDVFALFCGEMDKPIKVLQPSDIVPVGTELSLQRWYMQTDEYKAIRHDDAAIHHLCCEARAKIQRGDMHPSDEQLQQLEDFSDPFFPTERQYLEVAMKVSGYSMLVARGCTVVEALEDNAVTLCPGTLVTVSMDLCGLSVKCEGELQRPMLHWPWTVVRRWKRSASAETTYIKFEVCLQKQNAGILTWICLETPQALLLFQCVSALCAEIKRGMDDKRALLTDPVPSLAGRFHDPLREWVDNTLFTSGPRFSKIK